MKSNKHVLTRVIFVTKSCGWLWTCTKHLGHMQQVSWPICVMMFSTEPPHPTHPPIDGLRVASRGGFQAEETTTTPLYRPVFLRWQCPQDPVWGVHKRESSRTKLTIPTNSSAESPISLVQIPNLRPPSLCRHRLAAPHRGHPHGARSAPRLLPQPRPTPPQGTDP